MAPPAPAPLPLEGAQSAGLWGDNGSRAFDLFVNAALHEREVKAEATAVAGDSDCDSRREGSAPKQAPPRRPRFLPRPFVSLAWTLVDVVYSLIETL